MIKLILPKYLNIIDDKIKHAYTHPMQPYELRESKLANKVQPDIVI